MSPEICRKVREARREAGMSQSAVAGEIGCKQSALSMFEQGDGTKLNDEAVAKLCALFNVELPAAGTGESAAAPAVLPRTESRGYCPNPECPSHESYTVGGRLFLKPDRAAQDPAHAKFCAVCGEVLEKRCPSCGAEVHEGAVCGFCGRPYVAVARNG